MAFAQVDRDGPPSPQRTFERVLYTHHLKSKDDDSVWAFKSLTLFINAIQFSCWDISIATKFTVGASHTTNSPSVFMPLVMSLISFLCNKNKSHVSKVRGKNRFFVDKKYQQIYHEFLTDNFFFNYNSDCDIYHVNYC